ncbi:hypothetical protein ATH90_2402 [Pseudomonas lurida]|nr:hypothetical protein ATH90_2402 [Pseudomonas lurida]
MHGRVVAQESSIGLSGIQGSGIHGGLQCLGGVLRCDGSGVYGFEPTVFFHLVCGHRGQRWLGPHYDHCLEFTVYFPCVAMDEKFADIKFRHVEPSLGDNCTGETWPAGHKLQWTGQYGSCCGSAAQLSYPADETIAPWVGYNRASSFLASSQALTGSLRKPFIRPLSTSRMW